MYIITTDKKLIAFNYETQATIKTISLISDPTDIALGNAGSGIELYLPDKDGFLSIFDPTTLQKSNNFNVGIPIYSIATDETGYFYIFTYKNSKYNVTSYSRTDLKQISTLSIGYNNPGILRKIPNKNALISSSNSAYNTFYFKIGDKGNLVSYSSVSNFYNSFEVSINGDYIITTSSGYIYTTDGNFTSLGGLPKGDLNFLDFDTADNGNTIYACFSNSLNYVYIFNYSTRDITKQISTIGYPQRIFVKDTKLICLSRINSYDYSSANEYIFEMIPIN